MNEYMHMQQQKNTKQKYLQSDPLDVIKCVEHLAS